MKKNLAVTFLVCISILFCACKKSIFSNGDLTECDVFVDPFQVIEMRDNVNITLKHCDTKNPVGKIHIKTGENLIDGITAKVEKTLIKTSVTEDSAVMKPFNKLILRNQNKLDFLRPYDYPLEVTVYYDSILSIIFNSNATVTTDTLRGYDFPTSSSNTNDSIPVDAIVIKPNLQIEVQGGSGDLTVLTHCYRLKTKYYQGTGNVHVKGYTIGAIMQGEYNCHGIIDGKDLEAYWSRISFYGTNTIITKTVNNLTATNHNIGRIYYVKFKKPGQVTHWGHIDESGHWVHAVTVDTIFDCPQKIKRTGNNIMPLP